jgi:hypothetical protein
MLSFAGKFPLNFRALTIRRFDALYIFIPRLLREVGRNKGGDQEEVGGKKGSRKLCFKIIN